MALRLHWLGLNHTITHPDFSACAFTMKVYKGCAMMTKLGNTVYHYGNEDSEVLCSEHVPVISMEEWTRCYGDYDWRKEQFKYSSPEAKQIFTDNVVREVRKRYQPGDFLLCPWNGHKHFLKLFEDLKDLHVVESGIGYPTCFAPYRVFESSAKMHLKYGQWDAYNHTYQTFVPGIKEITSKPKSWEVFEETFPELAKAVAYVSNWDTSILAPYTTPHWADAVIPNYFDPNEFEFKKEKQEYALFMGRIIHTKGVEDAMRVCQEMGWKLIVAGQESIKKTFGWDPYDCVEEIGYADIAMRRELMANARCVFVPSHYIEPFAGVHMEALMSGTPVIVTDWGVFRETVPHGIVGWRCRSYEEMLWAAEHIDMIDPQVCRDWAMNFSCDRVSLMYQDYFENLQRRIAAPNKWYLYPEREDLDWLLRPYPLEKVNAKIDALKPKTALGSAYHPGGSIEGGDEWLSEPDVWDYLIKDGVKSVLDIGAGEGHAAKYFWDKDVEVTAIDNDAVAIKNAVHLVEQWDITENPLPGDKVDLIYMAEVLEHIPQKKLSVLAQTFPRTDMILITFAPPMSAGSRTHKQ